MRNLIVCLAAVCLAAGCTRSNDGYHPIDSGPCTPGEQRACACPGGAQGAQVCNASGSGFDRCFGCPGDGTDLAVPPGSDLAVSDSSMDKPDLTGTAGTPCAVVMILLDRSGSMGSDFDGSGSGPIKMTTADDAVAKIVQGYGGRVPFGLTTFENSTGTCTDGVQILVEPMAGSAQAIESQVKSVMPGGSTNTGEAMQKIAADPAMHDPARGGSYVVLVTDGAPNCDTGDPQAGIDAVAQAATGATPIDTFVIGLGTLYSDDQAGLEKMAQAGHVPCTGGFCDGHKYYPATTPQALDRALDLVMNRIVGASPGGSCGGFACFPSGAMCGSGQSCCGMSGCVSLQSSADNCGSCGNACGAGGACSSGHCTCNGSSCPPGDHCCAGGCCSAQVDMAAPPDLAPPPRVDMGTLPACVCNPACGTGAGTCVGPNCCLIDELGGKCTASNSCLPT